MPPSSSQGIREDEKLNKENKTATSASGATINLGFSSVGSPAGTIVAGEPHEKKEFDKMLKNIYYKQGYNSINGSGTGSGVSSGQSQRMSFFDKRNNTEKHLAALVSDPNNP